MIILLLKETAESKHTLKTLEALFPLSLLQHPLTLGNDTFTEIFLEALPPSLTEADLLQLPGVVRLLSFNKTKSLLSKTPDQPAYHFHYRGLSFSQDHFHLFPGLCAVDTLSNAKTVFRALQQHGVQCTRMGIYKPRTNPYTFQGLGKTCLPALFELAGTYGIQIIAIEVTHERQLRELTHALEHSGHPTGLLIQIGTRNAQNFELLRYLGAESPFPLLYKRGYGITLQESLQAVEYLAHAGNERILFCLRGVKSLYGAPHRNLADFAHLPLLHRLTRMPIGIDPSHAIGIKEGCPHGIPDIWHAAAQGVMSNANFMLMDFHPNPPQALVDSQQAIPLSSLEWFLEDIMIARRAWLKRRSLAHHWREKSKTAYDCQSA